MKTHMKVLLRGLSLSWLSCKDASRCFVSNDLLNSMSEYIDRER